MISLVTVVVDSVLERYFETFEKTICDETKIVTEVVLPKADADEDFYKEWTSRNIKFKMFGAKHHLWETKRQSPTLICLDHAMGLHAGIDAANNNYVMLSDPDVFFYTSVDQYYYDAMQKYKLNLVGLSHFSSVTEAYGFFPNVFNMMFKKQECPDQNWLAEELTLKNVSRDEELKSNTKIPGKYLMPGKLPGMQHYFPNPDGHYETGSVFLIWAKQQNWRWLSFQTSDVHNYTTAFYRSSFGLRENLGRNKLIYHATNGSTKKETYQAYLDNFKLHQDKK